MAKKWILGNGHNNFVVTRRSDLYPPEVGSLSSQTFSENFDQWSANEEMRLALLDMWKTVVPSPSRSSEEVSLVAVKSQLEELFRGGELVILNVQPRDVLPRIKEAASATEKTQQERPREKVTTWIEIELIDDKGKPVPREHYRIELPDGSIEDGVLDDQGRARHDGLDQGTCKVSFPEIHANEWQKV